MSLFSIVSRRHAFQLFESRMKTGQRVETYLQSDVEYGCIGFFSEQTLGRVDAVFLDKSGVVFAKMLVDQIRKLVGAMLSDCANEGRSSVSSV